MKEMSKSFEDGEWNMPNYLKKFNSEKTSSTAISDLVRIKRWYEVRDNRRVGQDVFLSRLRGFIHITTQTEPADKKSGPNKVK